MALRKRNQQLIISKKGMSMAKKVITPPLKGIPDIRRMYKSEIVEDKREQMELATGALRK